jgi:transcriptional regulator with XRE-family HTH domain
MRRKQIRNSDVAERLGVSEANVCRWLKGKGNVTIDTLYLLADAIDESLTISVGVPREVAAAHGPAEGCADDEFATLTVEEHDGSDGEVVFFPSPENVISLLPQLKSARAAALKYKSMDENNEARFAFA